MGLITTSINKHEPIIPPEPEHTTISLGSIISNNDIYILSSSNGGTSLGTVINRNEDYAI